MSPNQMKRIIGILCLLSWCTTLLAQESLMNGLEYGDYKVGFEAIQTHDNSRTYLNSSNNEYGPRPIEIGIWYPATIDENGSQARLNELPYFSNLDDGRYEFKSVINSEKLSGSFPLIIYSASQGSSGYENATLCEQIASYGYIVVTTESKGEYSRHMPFNESGVYSQFRDLEFLYGYIQNYHGVNPMSIGTVGFSLGGPSMMAYSITNKKVKAMVSLDGSIEPGFPILDSFSFLRMHEFNSDMLAFLGDKSNMDSFPPIERTPLSELQILKLRDLIHTDFSSTNLLFSDRPDSIVAGYISMSNLTVEYLNLKFKDESGFNETINSVPVEIYAEYRYRAKEEEPEISKNEYLTYISEMGIDEGIRFYHETKENFPNYQLFEYDPFRDIGYLLMLREEHHDAVKIYRVLVDAYPENPDSYRRLGEALMMTGNYQESGEYLRKGLELEPDSPALKAIMIRLDELRAQ